MDQMTFDFGSEDDKAEQPQIEEIKVEKKEVKKRPKKNTKAHQLAKEQRDIPVSEFFEQNRNKLQLQLNQLQ